MSDISYFGGDDGKVGGVRDGKPFWLGFYHWGDDKPVSAALAKALLLHLLGDEQRAMRLHRRFMYRSVVQWPADKPWFKRADELLASVRDIELVEQETAAERARVARERPMVRTEPSVAVPVGEDIPGLINNQRRK